MGSGHDRQETFFWRLSEGVGFILNPCVVREELGLCHVVGPVLIISSLYSDNVWGGWCILR